MINEQVESIFAVLRQHRFPLTDEKRLQAAMAEAFASAGIIAEREVRLSAGDIIDFTVGAVGIEVKVKGQRRRIFDQLVRYAKHERVEAIVLVTNVPMGMPKEINGKPVHVFNLSRAWL